MHAVNVLNHWSLTTNIHKHLGLWDVISDTKFAVRINLFNISSLQGQMNDASEVLGVIFECLHKSYTSRADCQVKSHEINYIGSWDCASSSCIAHCLFGMDILERMNCQSCRLESRRLKYTSFFHNINASSLRTAKVSIPWVGSHGIYWFYYFLSSVIFWHVISFLRTAMVC